MLQGSIRAGKGFFNGGTQNSGADIAEAFDVTGNIKEYEAGDVLVISTRQDRAVEKSSQPYSTLVAGVYATKPGVLLTEENIDDDLVEIKFQWELLVLFQQKFALKVVLLKEVT